MKKVISISAVILVIWAFNLLSTSPSFAPSNPFSTRIALAASCSVSCKLGHCEITCDPPQCARCRCRNGISPDCYCYNCEVPPHLNAPAFTFTVPCDQAKFSVFVGFASYLLGVEILTEYPVPTEDNYGIGTPQAGIDATTLLHIIAEDLGGWVKVGNPLPENYTPPASYVSWAGSSPVLAYRDNRDALIQFLGGDTIQPSAGARAERQQYEQSAQIIQDIQNELDSTNPKIKMNGICDIRTVNDALEAISYITGFRASIASPYGEAPAVSISCDTVGIPTLLRWFATWLNTPITVGGAMPYLPLEAIPDWIKESAPNGLYLYSNREDWIAVLGGESVLPDPDWAPLFEEEE
ncbi:MAG: hypothetical protein V2G52_03270 [bacterium JZ-2024 1]